MSIRGPVRWSFPAYPGALLFQYAAGTTTKLDTYTTSALSVQSANPMSADANGLFAALYEDPAKSYKYVLAPSTDADPPTSPIFEQDNVGETSSGLFAVITTAVDYAVVASDGSDVLILVDASAGARTITVYTAIGNKGRKLRVIKTDSSANTVTIDPSGTQTWSGSLTKILSSQWEASDGASDDINWAEFANVSSSSVVSGNSILANRVFA